MRNLSDRTLHLVTRAETAATAVGITVAVLVVAEILGLLTLPTWPLLVAAGLVVAGWFAGWLADGELCCREQAAEAAHAVDDEGEVI